VQKLIIILTDQMAIKSSSGRIYNSTDE